MGFMVKTNIGGCAGLALCLLLVTPAGQAASVAVSGIMGDKALVSVDGASPKVVCGGDTVGSVRIIEVRRDVVLIDNAGRRMQLGIGQANSYAGVPPPAAESGTAEGGAGSVVITADGRGQFLTSGSVNGRQVSFMVDTGATLVTLPRSVAMRAGVDFRNARHTQVSTANGIAIAQRVTLNQVRLGNIRANLVEALVVEDAGLPVALLGMSFLNRTDMTRQGDALTLKQRY